MLKTSLLILYGLPLALVFFWSYGYFNVRALNNIYAKASLVLGDRTGEFVAELAKAKPDQEELQEKEQSYLAYRRVGAAVKTSWSTLFEALEAITPSDVMFKRIKIKPDKLVRVVIHGEAVRLTSLTAFVAKLFKDRNFLNPMLKRHSRIKTTGPQVSFSLEVDYLGERGKLP